MATRQYIGARYVPKFFEMNGSTEWVSGIAYEGLTIVTRGSNSYTSKKPVPANIGAPESNPEYWVSTGIYNQQVEEYRQRVEQVEGEVEALDTRVDAVEEYGDRIDALEEKVHRKYVFIGDSYLAMTYFTHSWAAVACNILGATIGTDAWKYAHGGVGFAASDAGVTFGSLLTDAHNDLASIADEITDVIVAGGANDAQDAYSRQAINTAKDNFLANCRTYFPNARIFIGCIGGFQDYAQEAQLLTKVKEVYNYPGNVKGIPIENAHLPMLCNVCFADRTHPSEYGVRLIGEIIGTAVLGMTSIGHMYTIRYNMLSGATNASGVSFDSTSVINVTHNGAGINVNSTHLGITLSSAIQITFNLGAEISLFSKARGTGCLTGILPVGNSNLGTIDCTVYALISPGTSWAVMNGTLAFVYDDSTGNINVKLKIQTAPQTLSSVTSLRVEGLNGTLLL